MANSLFPVYEFLNNLKENNNRSWFNDHKSDYEKAYQVVIQFAEALLTEMKRHDDIVTVSGKKSLYRIYRDVRFSRNKLPYKTNWGGSLKRATNALRGGYYYHIEPGNSFIAGGFFGPNPEDLKHIRKHIAQEDSLLRMTLNAVETLSYFGELTGERVKTAPKGFSKEHPAIDLLRYKQFILKHNFLDEEVLKDDFHIEVSAGFQRLRPFFDVMSEMLTTDLNGRSLI